MVKRITSLILVLAMLLAFLTGCGGDSAIKSEHAELYASSKGLSLFDTLEAIKGLKNFSFEMPVSVLPDGDDTQSELLYTASGVCYADTKQAHVAFTDGDGEPVTEIYVDGSTCYVNYSDAVGFVKSGYESLEYAELLSEDIEALDAIQKDSSEYLSVELQEDIWTTLESDSTAAIRDMLSKVYKSIKRDMAEKSKDSKNTSSITVAGADLQAQVLKVLESLTNHSKDYTSFLENYLSSNFGELIDVSGWTPEEITGVYWADFENLATDLSTLSAEGEWNDWSVNAISCGDEENGYTIDLTSTGSYNRNICLSVYPAEAEALEMPTDTVDYLSDLENAAYVYQAFRDYRRTILERYRPETMDEEDINLSDEDFLEGLEEDDSITELTVNPISGYERISSALAATEDGVDQEVPVFSSYSSAEATASELSEGATDIYQEGDGFSLEWYSLDSTTRSPKQIMEDNITGYEEVYRDEWEYEILTKPVSILTSDDGKKAVGAFAYHDDEEDADVTMINAAVLVDGSEYALCLEVRLYSDKMMNRDIKSVKDVLAYLDLEMPIDVES